MGLLDKLFGRFFKHSRQLTSITKDLSPQPGVRDWREEEKQRMLAFEKQVEPELATILRQKGDLNFSWESGGDEAFLTIEGTNDQNRHSHEDVEEYLVYKLEIPDAGEFEMKGEGKLFIRDNQVWAAYHSNTRFLQDYNEEKEEEIWEEVEAEEEERMLFTL